MTNSTELLSNIPAEVRTQPLWCQYYLKPDKDPKKKPSPQPTITWSDHANFRPLDYLIQNRAGTKHNGFQRLVTKDEDLVYIDLDGCRNKDTGELTPQAQELVETFDTYSEISKSGTGLHLVARGKVSADHDKPPIEIYAGYKGGAGKLMVWTGNTIDVFHNTIENRQEQLTELFRKVKKTPEPTITQAAPMVQVVTAKPKPVIIPDVPLEVLDGKLGRLAVEQMSAFPRAYSYFALLAAASVLVPTETNSRANLFVCLEGPVHTGKSSAFNYAFKLLPPKERLMKCKAGSAEGLVKRIGDMGGRPILLYPDELAHLLEKSQIEGSSFPRFLTTAFYEDTDELIMAKGKDVKYNARLSLAGGLVTEQFGDLFGSATTGGLYDRFLFGRAPTGARYLWRPLDDVQSVITEDSLYTEMFVPVRMDGSVLDERDRWIMKEGIDDRVAELALRCAVVAASFDGRSDLTADMLGPTYEMAKYQTRARLVLQPNPGENPDARMAFSIRNWMAEHAQHGAPAERRDVYRGVSAQRLGPAVFDRAIRSMAFNGELEIVKDDKCRDARPAQIRMVSDWSSRQSVSTETADNADKQGKTDHELSAVA